MAGTSPFFGKEIHLQMVEVFSIVMFVCWISREHEQISPGSTINNYQKVEDQPHHHFLVGLFF